jgi:hypothetical protein
MLHIDRISVLASSEICTVAMFVVLTTGTETKLYQGSEFRAFRMAHACTDRTLTIGNIERLWKRQKKKKKKNLLWNGKNREKSFEKPISECVFFSVSILIESYRPAIPKFGQRGYMRQPTIFTINNK